MVRLTSLYHMPFMLLTDYRVDVSAAVRSLALGRLLSGADDASKLAHQTTPARRRRSAAKLAPG